MPQLQAQITLNSSGSATFDNNATIDGNTTMLGSVKIGTTSNNSLYRLHVYNNVAGSGGTTIRAYTSGSGGSSHYNVSGVTTGSGGVHRGLLGHANGGSSSNDGIYASANGSNNWAGYFSGSVYRTGSYQGSDQRLKKDIESVREAGILEKLNRLDPKRYQYLKRLRSQRLPSLNASERLHFGLLAQEVEQEFPELVRDVVSVLGEETGELPEDPELVTIKAINYQELSVLLLAAIQEMQNSIETLESAIQSR